MDRCFCAAVLLVVGVLALGAAKNCNNEDVKFGNATNPGLQIPKDCTVLDLGHNMLGSGKAKMIAEALKGSKVTELQLPANLLGDAGVKALAPGLTNVHTLNLQQNGLTAEAGKTLAAVLGANSKLSFLALNQNEEFGDAGLKHIESSVTSHTGLKTLQMIDTGLDIPSSKMIANILQKNDVLTELDVRGNKMPCTGAGHIAKALEGNKALRVLHLAGNPITNAGAKMLAHSLKQNRNLVELNLQACPIDDFEAQSGMKRQLMANQGVDTGTIDSTIYADKKKLEADKVDRERIRRSALADATKHNLEERKKAPESEVSAEDVAAEEAAAAKKAAGDAAAKKAAGDAAAAKKAADVAANKEKEAAAAKQAAAAAAAKKKAVEEAAKNEALAAEKEVDEAEKAAEEAVKRGEEKASEIANKKAKLTKLRSGDIKE